MNFITKEGKLFGKVSIIDIIAILAVIVLLVAGYLRLISPASRVITEPHEIEYVMLVRSVRGSTVRALRNFGLVSDGRTNEEMGEIIDLYTRPAFQEDALLDGTFHAFLMPDRYDVILTVRVSGRVNETGYYTFQNRALTRGYAGRIQTKHVFTSGEILEIRTIDTDTDSD